MCCIEMTYYPYDRKQDADRKKIEDVSTKTPLGKMKDEVEVRLC